ncbi:N-acetylmuramoyl-L-alanine amidase [Paenibacillus harenae]|uniref:N-acetylmuramoyl-L-alanine amidase n=1 Tax=Paenibacillus harenae TaxID=306543 RepID=UPI002793338D|nr:peptidoglycan recognition family protein [Paenibacillus harenae]MDQ0062397.1 N-acetyl-anhydromuramyl-L-alanine amidase AmpD [Paenibacillus harenae]
MDIIDKPVPSFNERNGKVPVIIVNHISVGTMGSMYNTFANKANRASSHFGVGRDGSIVQYVDINKAAWTQGRIQAPTASIIKQLMGDPNKYGVSIEHEGYPGHGLDGDLTEEQFYATCWLHKHIQTVVEAEYGVKIPLNSHQVLGHYQIDSIGKPLCPGRAFPWARLYSELAIADSLSLEVYGERLEYLKSTASEVVNAYAFSNRVKDLRNKFEIESLKENAKNKVLMLTPILPQIGFTGEVTPERIAEKVSEVYNNSLVKKNNKEGIRKLLIGYNFAKQLGLL